MSTNALAFEALVGDSGTGVAARGTSAGTSNKTCASDTGMLRVDPGSADNSLLWLKLDAKVNGTAAPCGNPMPGGTAAALTQAELAEVASWINAGASND